MTARNIRIVLVRPKENKNIGSVCRAMKTMGFGALYIVGHETIHMKINPKTGKQFGEVTAYSFGNILPSLLSTIVAVPLLIYLNMLIISRKVKKID